MLGVEVQLSAYTKACYGGVAVKTRRVSTNKVRYKRAGSCQARYGSSTARGAATSRAVRGGLHYLRDSRRRACRWPWRPRGRARPLEAAPRRVRDNDQIGYLHDRYTIKSTISIADKTA